MEFSTKRWIKKGIYSSVLMVTAIMAGFGFHNRIGESLTTSGNFFASDAYADAPNTGDTNPIINNPPSDGGDCEVFFTTGQGGSDACVYDGDSDGSDDDDGGGDDGDDDGGSSIFRDHMHSLKVTTLVSLLALLVVLGLVIGFFEAHMQSQATPATVNDFSYQVQSASRSGDYNQALQGYQVIAASPTTTPDQLARAARSVANAQFKISGNVNDLINNIPTLKTIVANPQVSANLRATILNSIIYMYTTSGKNPAVLAAIFTGDPYKSLWNPADKDGSINNLWQYSMTLYPTSRAAIELADANATRALYRTSLSSSERSAAISSARSYLVQAQTLLQAELQAPGDYQDSGSYLEYLKLRAQTVGRLAIVAGEPYKGEYRQVFDNLFTTLATSTAMAGAGSAVAHWNYATALLLVDNDVNDARSQLALALQANALAQPQSIAPLALALKVYEQPGQPVGKSILAKEAAISDQFNTFVNGLSQ